MSDQVTVKSQAEATEDGAVVDGAKVAGDVEPMDDSEALLGGAKADDSLMLDDPVVTELLREDQETPESRPVAVNQVPEKDVSVARDLQANFAALGGKPFPWTRCLEDVGCLGLPKVWHKAVQRAAGLEQPARNRFEERLVRLVSEGSGRRGDDVEMVEVEARAPEVGTSLSMQNMSDELERLSEKKGSYLKSVVVQVRKPVEAPGAGAPDAGAPDPEPEKPKKGRVQDRLGPFPQRPSRSRSCPRGSSHGTANGKGKELSTRALSSTRTRSLPPSRKKVKLSSALLLPTKGIVPQEKLLELNATDLVGKLRTRRRRQTRTRQRLRKRGVPESELFYRYEWGSQGTPLKGGKHEEKDDAAKKPTVRKTK